ncbi:MAG: hypothetical protein JGK08_11235 [Microcoleus sp. PH2017_04_SCI_O_A]|nr:hypothetical protein [Microcoleus sp. PH2017_04_SCI_O_A]
MSAVLTVIIFYLLAKNRFSLPAIKTVLFQVNCQLSTVNYQLFTETAGVRFAILPYERAIALQ